MNSFNKHRWIIFQKILFTSNTNFTLNRFSIIILNFNDTKIISCIKNLPVKEEKITIFILFKQNSPPDFEVYEKATDIKIQEHRTIEVVNDANRWNSQVNFDWLEHRHVQHDCIPSCIWKRNWRTNWFVCFRSIVLFFIRIEFRKKKRL